MNSPGSMQKKFMYRAHLPGNSSKKLQISVQKVSTRKNIVPGPRRGSFNRYFLKNWCSHSCGTPLQWMAGKNL